MAETLHNGHSEIMLLLVGPLNITAAQYEFKPAFFQFISQNQFTGTELENPNDHLKEFQAKCGTVKYQGISDEAMKL